MTEPAADAAPAVDAVVTAAGLPVTEADRERLIRLHRLIQQWTASVRLDETPYAEPALIYPADPAKWAGLATTLT